MSYRAYVIARVAVGIIAFVVIVGGLYAVGFSPWKMTPAYQKQKESISRQRKQKDFGEERPQKKAPIGNIFSSEKPKAKIDKTDTRSTPKQNRLSVLQDKLKLIGTH